MGGARRAPRIVCWGELLWDVFPDRRRLGGAPANAAYHAAVLGNRATLVTRVGRDPLGDAALRRLREAGVDTACVQRDDLPTGQVLVELSGGEPRYDIRHPSAWDRIAFDAACARAVERAHALVFGTLAQRDGQESRDALSRAIDRLPDQALRVCDLNLRKPYDRPDAIRFALSRADIVKLNQREADIVGDVVGAGDPVAWMFDRGVALVALTRGAEGSALLTREGHYEHRGPRAAGGDPVGAGDAYTAVLVHHLLRRTPLDLTAELCNRYAGFVASRAGGMPAVPPDVRRAIARQ